MKARWVGWFDVKYRTRPADDGMYLARFEIWAPDGSDPKQVHEDDGANQAFPTEQEALDAAKVRADAWCDENYTGDHAAS